MKKSLSQQLYDLLNRRNEWIHGIEIQDFARSLGYSGGNADRRLREMRKVCSVESELRVHNGVRVAWWRVKNKPPQVLPEYRREIITAGNFGEKVKQMHLKI